MKNGKYIKFTIYPSKGLFVYLSICLSICAFLIIQHYNAFLFYEAVMFFLTYGAFQCYGAQFLDLQFHVSDFSLYI